MVSRVTLVQGDITKVVVDAIVNAANEGLLGGGGVDGAIHRAAGPELLAACRALPVVRPGVRCPTGEARITPAFRLSARHVIHAVGPIYGRHSGEAALLAGAFRSSLTLAEEHACATVALPAISCGVYAYPLRKAAQIALAVAHERAWAIREIRFVLYSDDVLAAWKAALEERPAGG